MTNKAKEQDEDYKDYLTKVNALKAAQKATEKAYINKKAPYAIGSKVMIDTSKEIFPLIVTGYKILSNGDLEPKFKEERTNKMVFNANFKMLYKL